MIAFRRMIRRHLERVVKENSHKGLWFLTPWQYAVWRHQVQAESRVFSHPFPIFSTTWTVNTGWRPYHGYLTYCWIFRPEGAVQAARELRSEGWEDVFICSTRFGLAGPSHYVTGDLEDPAQFSRLALELEREQSEGARAALAAGIVSSLIHLSFHIPAAIVRGLIQVGRFALSREKPSWYDFWAILAWRISRESKPDDPELTSIPGPLQWPTSMWWIAPGG